jgi:hypothetical protein
MKNVSILFIALVLTGCSALATAGGYEKSMQTNIDKIDTARTAESFLEIANSFERIANAESEKWLPAYYAGYTHLYRSFFMKGDKPAAEAALDQAEKWAGKAVETAPGEDEVYVLLGYIDMIRLSLDPASRGQSMTPKVMQQFGRAMQMDPQNPRAMALMARMKMGTAQFFGQSMEEPCGMAQASLKLFDAEAPAPLHPRWGKELALEMIEGCKK